MCWLLGSRSWFWFLFGDGKGAIYQTLNGCNLLLCGNLRALVNLLFKLLGFRLLNCFCHNLFELCLGN